MSKPRPSLYDRIGGRDAVPRSIDELYRRILADPELSPFFANADIDRIRRMQREFFTIVLGDDDIAYSDLSLARVHANRGITEFHFNRFVQHLLDILRERGADADDVNEVAHRLSLYRNDIIGEAY